MTRLRRVLDRWVLAGRPRLVRLHPGDVVVIEPAGPLTLAEEARLRDRAEEIFGYHHDVLILDGGATLTVVADMGSPGR